jgi:hypothetical protein
VLPQLVHARTVSTLAMLVDVNRAPAAFVAASQIFDITNSTDESNMSTPVS